MNGTGVLAAPSTGELDYQVAKNLPPDNPAGSSALGPTLRVDAAVSRPDPLTGELVGLSVRDAASGREYVASAVFRPEHGADGWDPVSSKGVSPRDALMRLPFSVYRSGVEDLLSHARLVVGPHVERDLGFLARQGVRIDPGLLHRSVLRERRRLAHAGTGA